MTYTPKHRKEPKNVWRVFMLESERGWGRDEWHTDFDTKAEATKYFYENQDKPGHTPDYYIIATSIKEVETY